MATPEILPVSYQERLEKSIREILNKINHLPLPGTPGYVMAYSDKVYPQVLSEDGRSLICAADYKKGRIISFAHNGLLYIDGSNPQDQQLKLLWLNSYKWLSKGVITDMSVNESRIVEITDDGSVGKINSNTKVVIWNHNDKVLSEDSENAVSKFVENGGGLLHSVTSWAYYSYVNAYKIPLHGILMKAGITYSDEYDILYGNDNGFPIVLNDEYFTKSGNINLYVSSFKEQPFLESGTLLSVVKYLETMVQSRPDFQERLLHVYRNNVKRLKIPKEHEPISTNLEKSMVVLDDLLSRQAVEGMEVALGTQVFPGLPNLSLGPLDLRRAKVVELSLVSTKKDIFATGYYLAPGKKGTVTVISGSSDGWSIQIGAHSDYLYPDYQPQLKRYCYVTLKTSLVDSSLKVKDIRSPYGGLIYIESPADTKSTISLRLSRILTAPHFNIDSLLNVRSWDERKMSPSPWADICGQFITITLPSDSVREVDNLSAVIRMWDQIVCRMHFLRGTDVTKYQKQWIVSDVQPSHGYMHAGYPIVTQMDIADPQNDSFILGGNWASFWGFYHELGHNFQRDSWTFDGSREVTCNIFSMYCVGYTAGSSPMGCDWVQGQMPHIKQVLKSGQYNFEQWKSDATLAIGIYAQLCEHLGWDCMRHVLRLYEQMEISNTAPKDNQDKINTWFLTYSNASNSNLAPLFEFWNWPISQETLGIVSGLVPFLPDDEITQAVPERVSVILGKYNDIERSVTQVKYPDEFQPKLTVMHVENY